jgi:hypothetical protein
MINWKPVKDRIIEGDAVDSKTWILLDKEGVVISMYIKYLDWKEKFFPEDEVEEDPEFMQFRAEIELEKLAGRVKLLTKLAV